MWQWQDVSPSRHNASKQINQEIEQQENKIETAIAILSVNLELRNKSWKENIHDFQGTCLIVGPITFYLCKSNLNVLNCSLNRLKILNYWLYEVSECGCLDVGENEMNDTVLRSAMNLKSSFHEQSTSLSYCLHDSIFSYLNIYQCRGC